MKTHNRPILARVATLALLAITAVSIHAADIAGKWTWTQPGRNGGPDRTSTLTLATADGKLSGKVATTGRDGNPVETPITDAKLDGENVSFSVVREFNGTPATAKYSGKVDGDKITGKIETTRGGQPQSRDWEAKRVKDAK